MIVIVDTREQTPLWTLGVVRRKLLVGDYSTEALETSFSIERKTPQDLYGTILQGNVRFRKELIRAKNAGIQTVVFVDSTKKNFLAKKFPQGHLRLGKSEVLEKIITTFSIKYQLEFVWCRNTEAMKTLIVSRLQREENKLKYHGNKQRQTKRRKA